MAFLCNFQANRIQVANQIFNINNLADNVEVRHTSKYNEFVLCVTILTVVVL